LGKRSHPEQIEDILDRTELEKALKSGNGQFLFRDKTKVASPGLTINNRERKIKA